MRKTMALGAALLLLTGCGPRGRVALTFDDDFVDLWWANLGLLQEHDVHVTFFVTRWDSMTDEELVMLDDLDAAGHELAHHGFTHDKPSDYVAEHGLQAYIDDQIVPATEIMSARGYPPAAYSYPWGGRSEELDAALAEHFEVLRDSGRVDQASRSVYEDGDGVLAHGARIDSGLFEMADLTSTLEEAQRVDGTVVLYAHRILEESEAIHITPAELEAVLGEVERLGLHWITISQLRE